MVNVPRPERGSTWLSPDGRTFTVGCVVVSESFVRGRTFTRAAAHGSFADGTRAEIPLPEMLHAPWSQLRQTDEPADRAYWAQRAREHDRQTASAEAEAEADRLISHHEECGDFYH